MPRTPATARPATLATQLVEHLRQMIFDGDLEPGSRLTEEDLSQRFGVSRTPVREALKVLATEGMITITPHRGATVATLAGGVPASSACPALLIMSDMTTARVPASGSL